jgi:hypothetical protein
MAGVGRLDCIHGQRANGVNAELIEIGLHLECAHVPPPSWIALTALVERLLASRARTVNFTRFARHLRTPCASALTRAAAGERTSAVQLIQQPSPTALLPNLEKTAQITSFAITGSSNFFSQNSIACMRFACNREPRKMTEGHCPKGRGLRASAHARR